MIITTTADRLAQRADGAAMLSAVDAAAERKRVLRGIADEVISELTRRDEQMSYYESIADPDFVFVEEEVSVRLAKARIEQSEFGDSTVEAVAVCGYVFEWLLKYHGVQPPTWFLQSTEVWK